MKNIFAQYDNIKKNYQLWLQANNVIQEMNIQTASLIKRPIKANGNHAFPSFIGQADYAEWTYIDNTSNSLNRVAYLCKNNTLIKRQWPALDSVVRNNYHDRILMNNLTECRFRYLYHNMDIKGLWIAEMQYPTPKGMQIIWTFNNQQTIQLWFAIPPFKYEFQ